MPFRPAAMAAGCALLLAACSLGPDYQTAAAWPSATWWRGFRSDTLDQLITDAMRQNFDIVAAAARVRQADAQLVLSGAALLPSATLNSRAGWSHSYGSVRTANGIASGYVESRSYSLAPTISYEVDLWGKLRAIREAAADQALASRFDQQTVALTVVTAVAGTWFQALALQDRIDIANRNLRESQQVLDAITARMSVGTASALDVSQQAALVAGIRAQIPGLQNQLQQQLNALGILLGRPPSAITARPGTLNTLALPPTAPGLPSELLARRPDIAFAEANLRSANANIKVARASFFPDLTLTGQGGWQNIGLGVLFGPGSVFANAAANAAQPLFDNGALSANVALRQAQYDELAANYRKAIVQGFTDVENAITAFNQTTEQEQRLREAVAVAQRAADIARAQMVAGTADITTVVQIETTLFSDLDQLAQIRGQRFAALLALYKALGGGWASDDVTPPDPSLLNGVL